MRFSKMWTDVATRLRGASKPPASTGATVWASGVASTVAQEDDVVILRILSPVLRYVAILKQSQVDEFRRNTRQEQKLAAATLATATLDRQRATREIRNARAALKGAIAMSTLRLTPYNTARECARAPLLESPKWDTPVVSLSWS